MDVIVAPRADVRLPSRHRISIASSLAGIAVAGATLVVVTWWQGAAPGSGAGARLTDSGRLAGLLAGYVALVQLLLRSRLGVIERGLGTDAINAAHRLLGSYLVVLVLGHATLVTAGYAASNHATFLAQAGSLLTSYPYVLWAAIAAALLVAIGLTSVPRIRRLLPYEIWHGLHLTVYVALGLAFLHQVTVGQHFVQDARARIVWTVAWLTVAGLIVCSRWLKPLGLTLRHRLTISAVHRETHGVVSIEIAGRRLDAFPGEAGQYFRWRLLTRGRWYAAHPYSLSAEPDGHRLRITATVNGRHSRTLPSLTAGTRVIAEGPCGGLLAVHGWTGPVLMIAGGMGITPLRALFATCSGAPVTLIYRAHAYAAMPLRDELDDIAQRLGRRVCHLAGSRTDPVNQLTAGQIADMCPEVRGAQVYVCGSAAFVRDVLASLSDLRVPRARIRAESFELA